MITRSKARAVKKAQDEAKSRQPTQTPAPLQQPSPRVYRNIRPERRPDQVIAGSHEQVQLQRAEIEAALLAAIAQMAAGQSLDVQAGAAIDQQPFDATIFEAAALEHLATVRARLDLMRTSCRIALDYFRIATMAYQASAVVQQKLTLVSSYFLLNPFSRWLGACPSFVAIALLVLLLHLFNVLCVRRVWTRESLAERVAASAAFVTVVGEFLESSLEWILDLQFYVTLVSVWG